MWEVQPKDKTYTERTFADARAAMEKAMQQMEAASQQAQAQQPQQQLPINAGGVSVLVSRRRVEGDRRAGDDRGQSNEPQIVSLKQTCKDLKTMKSCDMVCSIEEWLTAQAPGMDESRAFAQSYAKRWASMRAGCRRCRAGCRTRSRNTRAPGPSSCRRPSTFQGYPLKSAMQMSMGGPQCTTDDGTQVASAPVFADAVEAGVEAGVGTAAGEVASAATQAAVSKVGGGAAGSVAGLRRRRFREQVRLLDDEQAPQEGRTEAKAAAAAPAEAGMIRLFRVQTETTAIRADAIPASTFDVPAGYKKVAATK